MRQEELHAFGCAVHPALCFILGPRAYARTNEWSLMPDYASIPDSDASVTSPDGGDSQPELTLEQALAERDAARQQYKGIQRELEKARRRGEATAAMQSQLTSALNQVALLTEAIGSMEAVPEEARTRLLQGRVQSQQQDANTRVRSYYDSEIEDMLSDAGMDRDDKRLAEANRQFEAGQFAEALRTSRKVAMDAVRGASGTRTAGVPGRDEVETKVQETVNQVLKEMGVKRADTKEGTVPARRSRDSLLKDLDSFSLRRGAGPGGQENRRFLEEARKKLDELYNA